MEKFLLGKTFELFVLIINDYLECNVEEWPWLCSTSVHSTVVHQWTGRGWLYLVLWLRLLEYWQSPDQWGPDIQHWHTNTLTSVDQLSSVNQKCEQLSYCCSKVADISHFKWKHLNFLIFKENLLSSNNSRQNKQHFIMFFSVESFCKGFCCSSISLSVVVSTVISQ